VPRTLPTIELDGVVYTARPYTNALRAKLGEQIEKRQADRARAARLGLVVQTLQQNSTLGGPVPDTLADQVSDNFDEIDKLQRSLEDSALELAPILLVDPDGKAVTKKTVEEHADVEDLADVVAVALREQPAVDETPEPSPTTAGPAES
jgi:hypothetical protein